jgi:hypothetical protein
MDDLVAPLGGHMRVEVQGGEIVVTASDTDYVVTYHKPANSPQLLAKSYSRKEDRRRELGWIV